MNALKKSILLGGCVAAFTFCTTSQVQAQGRGGFDPQQMKEMRLDRLHEDLGITNEEDWKAIEPLATKVLDAQQDVFRMRVGGMFGGGRGMRRNRNNDEGGGNNNNGDQPRRNRNNNMFSPPESVTALQKAVEDKAPTSELKAKLAAMRADAKEKEAKLSSAEDDLKKYLTARQEAVAVVDGFIR